MILCRKTPARSSNIWIAGIRRRCFRGKPLRCQLNFLVHEELLVWRYVLNQTLHSEFRDSLQCLAHLVPSRRIVDDTHPER